VGVHASIVTASLDAVLSALNRLHARFADIFPAVSLPEPSARVSGRSSAM
jgi:hypothetical protein